MKRLGRWLGCVSNSVCLLICILMFCLWIRSFWKSDTVLFSGTNSIVGFSSDGDVVLAYIGNRYMPNRDGLGWVHFSGYPEARPMDRMICVDDAHLGDLDWFVLNELAWGTRYQGIILLSWKVFAIFALLAAKKPLGLMELKVRSHFRTQPVSKGA
ncbi:MAG TPA: hypothetical protein VMU31_03910 [Rhizomicrobium sp.]|nr:hypothetical protein [Rhizomicrobium sp.]